MITKHASFFSLGVLFFSFQQHFFFFFNFHFSLIIIICLNNDFTLSLLWHTLSNGEWLETTSSHFEEYIYNTINISYRIIVVIFIPKYLFPECHMLFLYLECLKYMLKRERNIPSISFYLSLFRIFLATYYMSL